MAMPRQTCTVLADHPFTHQAGTAAKPVLSNSAEVQAPASAARTSGPCAGSLVTALEHYLQPDQQQQILLGSLHQQTHQFTQLTSTVIIPILTNKAASR